MALSPDELQKALREVEVALSPLPDGYYVQATDTGNGVIVACKHPEPDGLGFGINEQTIRDGRHVEAAVENFTGLMRAVETGGRSDGAATSHVQ